MFLTPDTTITSDLLNGVLAARGIEFHAGDTGIVQGRWASWVLTGLPTAAISTLRRASEDLEIALGVDAVVLTVERGRVTLSIARRDWQAAPLVLPAPGTLLFGHGITGDAVTGTLEDLPHLLVCGASGSGKSVALHCILRSLAALPASDMNLILIDTKFLEFAPYNGLKHIYTHGHEVITDHMAAARFFTEAVGVMERRYREGPKKYKPIVIVVDEFADLISGPMGTYIQEKTLQLAQKARAAHMHLILATQRPSVKVLPGDLKANIPSRLTLKTATAVDSRVSMDANGAEKLLGKGDGFYLHNGKLTRLQVPFATAADVIKVAQ